MKIHLTLLIFFSFLFCYPNAEAQNEPDIQYLNPEVYQGEFVKKTIALRDLVIPDFDGVIVRGENLGGDNPSPFGRNEKKNDNALPLGEDPVWQKQYPNTNNFPSLSLLQNFEGINYTSINPPDPCADVGPNHVIQMTNASGGSVFKIWDKNGTVLQDQTFFDDLTGISGFGDPIVLYDEVADRWMMSEFPTTGNILVIAISETADPVGSWFVYSYSTPLFPDYPKYALWNDAYVVTTNEQGGGPNPAVYAFDRTQMLSGNPGTFQRFVVPTLPGLALQVLTPVDFDGTIMPPSGTDAYLMRMVDDGWDPSLTQDQLDLFEFDIDFATPANTSITLVQEIATAPFDTDFCGGTPLIGCLQQQGSSITLFALSQILMNRISYRNFGTHESIVVCHTVDVTGTDRAGVRWYELRRTSGSSWSIFQQGTYAPTSDSNSRWMAGISINEDGSIGLAYNVAGPTAFPGIRYTGRLQCDTPGSMTVPETVIFEGLAPNNSNRYGDYSSLDVDPINGSFWFTGECNPSNNWSTRIANFDLEDCNSEISFAESFISLNENEADIPNNCLDYKEVGVTIMIESEASMDPTVTLILGGTATDDIDYEAPAVLSATLSAAQLSHTFIFKVFNDAYVETLEELDISYSLNANGGNAIPAMTNQTVLIEIQDDDLPPALSPGPSTSLYSEDFENNNLGSCTSTNIFGTQLFSTDTNANASSTNFTIPSSSPGSFVAFLNDDNCTCELGEVHLDLPPLDFSTALEAVLNFDCYFEGITVGGESELLTVFVSVDNGNNYTTLQAISGLTSWQNINVDLNAYAGLSNVLLRIVYSDGGITALGIALDNIDVSLSYGSDIQLEVNSTLSDEQYLGPNETVYFYDPATGKIMLSVENNSNHDYGCTTVEVDRSGVNPSALEFATTEQSEFLASKSFKISPTNPSSSGSYALGLYYEEAEIAAWETITGNSRNILEIAKVAGNNHISDVTPATEPNFTISFNPSTLNTYMNDHIVSATISSGFSGFGIGIPYDLGGGGGGGSSCTEFFTNTWIGPSSAMWYGDASYWSLSRFPDYCDNVIIPPGNNIIVLNGEIGKAFTLFVDLSSQFETEPGAILDVLAP